jgi:hypothetical protein
LASRTKNWIYKVLLAGSCGNYGFFGLLAHPRVEASCWNCLERILKPFQVLKGRSKIVLRLIVIRFPLVEGKDHIVKLSTIPL